MIIVLFGSFYWCFPLFVCIEFDFACWFLCVFLVFMLLVILICVCLIGCWLFVLYVTVFVCLYVLLVVWMVVVIWLNCWVGFVGFWLICVVYLLVVLVLVGDCDCSAWVCMWSYFDVYSLICLRLGNSVVYKCCLCVCELLANLLLGGICLFCC